jgi:hypothetical protein
MIFVLNFVILAVGPWPCVDKAAKNPSSTTVLPLFLRELRGKVRENVGQVEDAYPAKVNSCFEPPRCHSKISSHQVLRQSSFVQKHWRSICCVRIKVFQLFEARKRPVFKDSLVCRSASKRS